MLALWPGLLKLFMPRPQKANQAECTPNRRTYQQESDRHGSDNTCCNPLHVWLTSKRSEDVYVLCTRGNRLFCVPARWSGAAHAEAFRRAAMILISMYWFPWACARAPRVAP
jgi:hypothetical protein